MKKVILMLMLFAPLSIFAQKFGHLDSQALISSLPEAIRVQGELEALGKQYESELTAMQNELQKKAEDYDKTKSTMNATKQAETEQSLQEMYNKIQQAASDNQQAFNKAQQEKLGPILDKVRKAIETVANNGKYVYIMEQSAGQPIYVNTSISVDVTSEVKAELDKMK
ncbi:MAG: OmpH family outer membrane protein [Prevotella sp.]|jgi:outer membrane protein|nr:OmpH family outer membrane protein [Prevotella sp.]MBR1620499.1 OmpH family outer membrane protein [Prevotella sp.]